MGRRAQLAQERLDATVGILVAADHDRQRPRLHLRDASGNGRVEHPPPLCTHAFGQVPARLRADRARVDPGRTGGEPGQNAVRPGCDLLENAVVGKGGEDDLDRVGDLACRVEPLQPLLDLRLGMLAVPFLAKDPVGGCEEALRHVSAHVTEPNEADPASASRPLVPWPTAPPPLD